jgi:hypothetical protein
MRSRNYSRRESPRPGPAGRLVPILTAIGVGVTGYCYLGYPPRNRTARRHRSKARIG